MDILLVLAGFAALIGGGEFLVRGAVAIASRLRISPLIIGLTLVGFGTSTPELMTSLQAALSGAPGIAVGNVVGSNIANILLILGIAAVISPIAVSKAGFMRDGGTMMVATLLCAGLVVFGELGRAGGAFLIAALAVYLWMTLRDSRGAPGSDDLPGLDTGMGMAALLALGGLVLTLIGARALVTGAVGIAADFGVSEAVIGLTVVAVGTSLPELVTSVVAARRGQADIAVGNILGSNIFNILGILGVTALVRPLQVPASIAGFDIWVMCGATALLIAVILRAWRLSRLQGAVFLAGYGAYLARLATTL
ncbi:calcium/sodium antiporter [Oceaniovalibus sp. ACAM 378]|uniref:calcium/sodium antiporter n=1 Tax=Oceaniovalibus sp. ACAM 378 TaxID=2599923 RepID=UPI0011D42443|nr:calcium/sodium antiporter [Oceaniovalibus sp. ACAM 378]TYB87710.1 calcium/sodium antiporter [Oceaniovalibus sp. ACAM 378]